MRDQADKIEADRKGIRMDGKPSRAADAGQLQRAMVERFPLNRLGARKYTLADVESILRQR
jgi:hypothetical protein